MKGNCSIVRPVFHRRFSNLRSSTPTSRSLSTSVRPYILAPSSMSSLIPKTSVFPASNIGSSVEFKFSNTSFPHRRSFCSAEGGEKGVVIVKSEEEFTSAFSKAQDVPSIFYFTAAWARPCSVFASAIAKLRKLHPDVITYKIDIDEAGISDTISKLNITAVPTLLFYNGDTKKGEVVGADVTKLKKGDRLKRPNLSLQSVWVDHGGISNTISKLNITAVPTLHFYNGDSNKGRFISPVIEELSKQYPDVTTYEINIDKGGISNTISKLNITAVPILHFFKGGSKQGEVVGADVTKLKNLMEQLYK